MSAYEALVARPAREMGMSEHDLFELSDAPWFKRVYDDALARIAMSCGESLARKQAQ